MKPGMIEKVVREEGPQLSQIDEAYPPEGLGPGERESGDSGPAGVNCRPFTKGRSR